MPITLMSNGTASKRSGSYAWGQLGNRNDVVITIRGDLGTGTGTIDVSHDGTNWVSTGTTLSSSTTAQVVTLSPGMRVSVNYTAGGSPCSWTIEAS